jgi:heme/copper-type cytochrome/quinol oxidase subunit 4
MAHDAGEATEMGRGMRVALLLAVLTILEYVAAIALQASSIGLVAVLTPIALLKAWAIFMYFMHLAKVWRGEEEAA